jgi:hypothetical protein
MHNITSYLLKKLIQAKNSKYALYIRSGSISKEFNLNVSRQTFKTKYKRKTNDTTYLP